MGPLVRSCVGLRMTLPVGFKAMQGIFVIAYNLACVNNPESHVWFPGSYLFGEVSLVHRTKLPLKLN